MYRVFKGLTMQKFSGMNKKAETFYALVKKMAQQSSIISPNTTMFDKLFNAKMVELQSQISKIAQSETDCNQVPDDQECVVKDHLKMHVRLGGNVDVASKKIDWTVAHDIDVHYTGKKIQDKDIIAKIEKAIIECVDKVIASMSPQDKAATKQFAIESSHQYDF
jgi:hypothetical protein